MKALAAYHFLHELQERQYQSIRPISQNFNSAMKRPEASPPANIPDYPFMTEIGAASQRDSDAITIVNIGDGRAQLIEALVDADSPVPGILIPRTSRPSSTAATNPRWASKRWSVSSSHPNA
jgi:hypothetical protein